MLITVLTHVYVWHFSVCVPFAGRRRRPIAVELLLVLKTDYSDWLVQVTEFTDNDAVFWIFTIVWLNNIELAWLN